MKERSTKNKYESILWLNICGSKQKKRAEIENKNKYEILFNIKIRLNKQKRRCLNILLVSEQRNEKEDKNCCYLSITRMYGDKWETVKIN